jgi:hypothetical protein
MEARLAHQLSLQNIDLARAADRSGTGTTFTLKRSIGFWAAKSPFENVMDE